jgi:protoporphyrinogen oxidase
VSKKIAIIGAGPAGLTAAYLLAKEKQDIVVFEKDAEICGRYFTD